MTGTRHDSQPPPVSAALPSRMRRDIGSAYVASLSRIASWVIVSAIVFRVLGPGPFALLALVRATVGLLNYLTLGLGPAMVHYLAAETQPSASADFVRALPAGPDGVPTLDYATIPSDEPKGIESLYANGLALAFGAAIIGFVAVTVYARWFDRLHALPAGINPQLAVQFVLLMGWSALLRLASEPAGAVLQVCGLITLDNLILAAGELLWIGTTAALIFQPRTGLAVVADGLVAASLLVLIGRLYFAFRVTSLVLPVAAMLSGRALRKLLSFGLLVAAAQLADYLYAPTDYILINRLIGPDVVALYAPAVQVDAGLLILVSGLSAVLLPKAAIAHAGGSATTVRRYYIRGTLASVLMLLPAAAVAWALAPWLFRLWLGNPMPVAQSVLPLILLHSVIGGSSAVGRSILLAVGRVRPFTVAVFIAGVTNVGCSYAFVRYLHWGLWGIVLGTTVAVVARCAIWMPWYVLRTLKTDQNSR